LLGFVGLRGPVQHPVDGRAAQPGYSCNLAVRSPFRLERSDGLFLLQRDLDPHSCFPLAPRTLAGFRVTRRFNPGPLPFPPIKDYQRDTGNKLRSHDLRKRFISECKGARLDVDTAAKMAGMTPQNARQSYLDLDVIDTDQPFDQIGAKLLPKSVSQFGPACQNPAAPSSS
jgi:hypothetical protein